MNNIQDRETNIVRDEELDTATGGRMPTIKYIRVTCCICRKTLTVMHEIKSDNFVCPDCKKR